MGYLGRINRIINGGSTEKPSYLIEEGQDCTPFIKEGQDGTPYKVPLLSSDPEGYRRAVGEVAEEELFINKKLGERGSHYPPIDIDGECIVIGGINRKGNPIGKLRNWGQRGTMGTDVEGQRTHPLHEQQGAFVEVNLVQELLNYRGEPLHNGFWTLVKVILGWNGNEVNVIIPIGDGLEEMMSDTTGRPLEEIINAIRKSKLKKEEIELAIKILRKDIREIEVQLREQEERAKQLKLMEKKQLREQIGCLTATGFSGLLLTSFFAWIMLGLVSPEKQNTYEIAFKDFLAQLGMFKHPSGYSYEQIEAILQQSVRPEEVNKLMQLIDIMLRDPKFLGDKNIYEGWWRSMLEYFASCSAPTGLDGNLNIIRDTAAQICQNTFGVLAAKAQAAGSMGAQSFTLPIPTGSPMFTDITILQTTAVIIFIGSLLTLAKINSKRNG